MLAKAPFSKRACLIVSILNFSRMTERFNTRRSKMDATPPPHPSLERWSTGCRTRTLCREEGPPRCPPSSRECLLLVPVPEPAWGPPVWDRPPWKAAAEHRTECDNLFLQFAGPIETHLAVVSTLLNSLLREPVSRDWSLVCLELLARCPEAEDRQGTAELTALETPEGVASLLAPLRFRQLPSDDQMATADGSD